jgi:hypothetical protein
VVVLPPDAMGEFKEKKQENQPHWSVADLILFFVCYLSGIPKDYRFTMYEEMDAHKKEIEKL